MLTHSAHTIEVPLPHQHHLHVTTHATGRRHVLHDVLDLVLLALVLVAVWFLWPVSFGGTTRFVIVQGTSMEPRYHLGDVVVAQRNQDPQLGDVVVFRIPEGEHGAGTLVVHRLHGVRDDGSFITKGDNRRYPDPWHVTHKEIVGTPSWTMPQFGRVVNIASNPFVLGTAAGMVTVLLLLPDKRRQEPDGTTDS